ncbi:S-layer homology domain-containing protein [Paenibacillus aestuarii]|uniref:S-layer homology domain-containing protein n=1 Tax=Paenibacillus aestuarii TaxID=516965 RepID=A0ABW0KE33_9BACL|nr:S-layer homology domain-containing protein [Paenibacillus aestuarii]
MRKKMMLTSVLSVFCFTGCQSVEATTEALKHTGKPAVVNMIHFQDMASHWAESSVRNGVAKGYVDGYEDSTFRPEQPVTRGEFIKMVMTAIKSPVDGTAGGAEWAKPYLVAAGHRGIWRENDFAVEQLNEPISRLEMSRIALRAADSNLQNKAMQMDDRSIMFNSAKKGLIQGLAGGELGLNEPTTRAQSVTMIERVLTVLDGGKLPVDKAAASYAEIELRGSNFETMWGIRVKEFPYDYHIGEGFDMTINKVVVIDHSDSNSAYFDLYKDGWLGNGTNSYTMAYDITLKNSSIKDHYIFYPRQSIGTVDYGTSFNKEIELKSSIWMDQIGEYQGWLGFNVKKETIDRILNIGNSPRVILEVQSESLDFGIRK